MNITIEIAKESNDWDKYPEINEKLFSDVTSIVLSRYPNLSSPALEIELSILLTNDAHMQLLNGEFRNKDKTTNVLSFPDIEIDWRNIVEFIPDNNYMYLGDIAFSCNVVAMEALEKSIDFQDHFKHLLIHALLHLIGYDHEEEDDAIVMESLEIEILKSMGIKSPY